MLDLLPLPLLSFFALPMLSSYSTSLNILFFYMTWSILVLSHKPLNLEIFGTLATKTLFYLLPSLGFLLLDCAVPSVAASIKSQGKDGLPLKKKGDRKRAAKIAAWSIFNTLLGVALQAGIEILCTEVLHFRSMLKVTTKLPMPLSIVMDLLRSLVVRGVFQYVIHRYILHSPNSRLPLARWHKTWHHSVAPPYAIAANYDHPISYLFLRFIPNYAAAYLFRMHILTFLLHTILISLEESFTYSGNTVLPSTIMMSGMARRVDAHMMSGGKGNFGPLGVLDWVCGTTVGGKDVMDDVGKEMDKHDAQGRIGNAVENGGNFISEQKEKVKKRGRRKSSGKS